MRSFITWSLATIALILVSSVTVSAQNARRTNVTVALVDTLPVATAKAVVVRKPDGSTLVALDRRHASPELLGAGLAVVRHLRKQPAPVGQQQVVPIQGAVNTRTLSADRQQFLRQQYRALTARPHGALRGLGHGRFLTVSDPTMAK
jgi:hypothetical protein